MGDRHKLLHKLKNRFLKDNGKDKKAPTREDDSGREKEKKSVKEKTASKRERRKKQRTMPSVAPREDADKRTVAGEGENSKRARKKKRKSVKRGGGETTHQPVDEKLVERTEKATKLLPVEKPPPDPHAEERNKWATAVLEKGVRTLLKEFAEQTAAMKAEKPDAAAFNDRANAEKSRYKASPPPLSSPTILLQNLPCTEATRVQIKEGGFLHANWINVTPQQQKRFILAQSPLDSVTAASFWAIVVQEEIENIVMLNEVDERDKDHRKSALHFPLKAAENQWNIYGDYKVATVKKAELSNEASVHVYTLLVKNAAGAKQTVKVYHWTAWPENGLVPEVSLALPTVNAAVRLTKKPILVHCSSGCGRSGCFVFFDMLVERMTAGGPPESVLDTLKDLRAQRYGAVQSDLQFLFVLRSVFFFLTTRNALDMSQMLLEFGDDAEAATKKLTAEKKEQREKRLAEGAKDWELPSHLSNELLQPENVPPTSDGNTGGTSTAPTSTT